MAFRAILFDLDGTLLNTLTDITNAANEALRLEGLPVHSEADYLRFIGDGIATTFRRALPPDRADDAQVERCQKHFQATYGQMWNVHTQPYAGIPELLDHLTRRGIALAVLSNKGDDFAKHIAAAYLDKWPFRAIHGLKEGVPRKPDPTAALQIAGSLGLEPAECGFVGDSAVDIWTGRNAGMYPTGVAWGFQTVAMLEEAGARSILHHPLDLLQVLGLEPSD